MRIQGFFMSLGLGVSLFLCAMGIGVVAYYNAQTANRYVVTCYSAGKVIYTDIITVSLLGERRDASGKQVILPPDCIWLQEVK